MNKPLFAALLMLAAAMPAIAGEAAPVAKDVALEKRVMALSEELRCLVCQNQTIADSNAPLAIDLKSQVREKLAAGMREREIIDYMVARYGDFVLYRPPVRTTTMLLWFGPPLLLVLGLWLFARTVLRRRAAPPLSTDEQARARALLDATENRQP
ncbi:MAG: cytochrome c-type biogenesis protein [Burkholderiales bacterium]